MSAAEQLTTVGAAALLAAGGCVVFAVTAIGTGVSIVRLVNWALRSALPD